MSFWYDARFETFAPLQGWFYFDNVKMIHCMYTDITLWLDLYQKMHLNVLKLSVMVSWQIVCYSLKVKGVFSWLHWFENGTDVLIHRYFVICKTSNIWYLQPHKYQIKSIYLKSLKWIFFCGCFSTLSNLTISIHALCFKFTEQNEWHRIHSCLASSVSSYNSGNANLAEYLKYILIFFNILLSWYYFLILLR